MPKPHQIDFSTKPQPREPVKCPLDPKPGSKRLYSNTYSIGEPSDTQKHDAGDLGYRRNPSQAYDDENDNELEENAESHSGKRHRASDWPLKNTADRQNVPSKAPLGIRSRGNGSSVAWGMLNPQPRPSKFVEGSMNDRVSQRPHPAYIQDEEEIHQHYSTEEPQQTKIRKKQTGGLTHHANRSVGFGSLADKSDTSRQPAIFRFGKSLSAAFNPSNWKIWSSKQQNDADDGDLQAQILRERRENAEMAYKEMKHRGQFQDAAGVKKFMLERNGHGFKHDSVGEFDQGISVDSVSTRVRPTSETSNSEKRYGRVFLEPPNIPTAERGESPTSEAPPSPHKSSFHFKKPSLSNLKLVSSSTQKSSPADGSTYEPERLKRLPSHKDLQKQQKLVKRVSDLEGKLEAARRQLSEVLGEPVPGLPLQTGRSRFKPGNLATLPSESLLSSYISPSEVVNPGLKAKIGMAITTNNHGNTVDEPSIRQQEPAASVIDDEPDDRPSSTAPENNIPDILALIKGTEVPDCKPVEVPLSKLSMREDIRDTAAFVAPVKRTSRKRKSIGQDKVDDGGRYKPPAADSADEDEFDEPKKLTVSNRKASRAVKLRKLESKPDSAESAKLKGQTSKGNTQKPLLIPSRALPGKKASLSNNGDQSLSEGHQTASLPSNLSTMTAMAFPMGSTLDRKALRDDDEAGHNTFGSNSPPPPIPKVPRTVIMSSGAVVKIPEAAIPLVPQNTVIHSSEFNKDKEGSKFTVDEARTKGLEGMEEGEKGSFKRNESFEWPADVF